MADRIMISVFSVHSCHTHNAIVYHTEQGELPCHRTKVVDMEIKGKVYCFFEQSGTFKQEFIKLGIPAEDYDIQNNFGQTDHVCDLFTEIEQAYRGGRVSLMK